MRWSPAASTGSLTYGYTVHPLAASASSLDPLLSPRAADRLPVGIPIDTMARCSLLEPPPQKSGPGSSLPCVFSFDFGRLGVSPHFLKCRPSEIIFYSADFHQQGCFTTRLAPSCQSQKAGW